MINLFLDEHIVLTARKHWLIFLIEAFGITLVAFIAIALLGTFDVLLSQELYDSIGADRLIAFNIVAISGILLVYVMVLATIFTDYYLDIVVLTTTRVLECDQKRLFVRDVVTIPIQNIVDVRAETNGIIQTFFNYGSIYVHTAGATREFIMRGIAKPHEVKSALMEAFQKNRTGNHSESI